MYKKIVSLASVLAVAGSLSQTAFAVSSVVTPVVADDTHKVTICHATNSVKNPYVRETVDADAADGNTANDNGNGDHSTHTGPVATSEAQAQTLKDAKTEWGDIIPPHDNYSGLNYGADGQAVYNNDCKYVVGGGQGGPVNPPVVTPTTPAAVTPTTPSVTSPAPAPQVKTPVVSVVSAGAGGGIASATTSVAAFGASLLALGYGALRLRKFNS